MTKTKAQAELDALRAKKAKLAEETASLDAREQEILTFVQDEAIAEFLMAVKTALDAAKAKGVAIEKLAAKLPKALRSVSTGTSNGTATTRERRADYKLHDKLKGSGISLRALQAAFKAWQQACETGNGGEGKELIRDRAGSGRGFGSAFFFTALRYSTFLDTGAVHLPALASRCL
jgi:hypothetical protein